MQCSHRELPAHEQPSPRYVAREIDGRWAIYDTVAERVTGYFGRGEAERLSAVAHAEVMNEAVR